MRFPWLGALPPNPRDLALSCRDILPSYKGAACVAPGYLSLRVGAQVASPRCPILRSAHPSYRKNVAKLDLYYWTANNVIDLAGQICHHSSRHHRDSSRRLSTSNKLLR